MNQKHNPLPPDAPVPVPPARRWQEFRIRYVPVLVFLAVAAIVAVLWQDHVAPAHISGFAVAAQHEIRSPQDGYVSGMQKWPLDVVADGEHLLTLQPANAAHLQAELTIIEAEIEALRAGLGPAIGPQRNLINYEELRLTWMQARIRLAEDRLTLAREQREFDRQTELFDHALISVSEYDATGTRRDIAAMRVDEQGALVESLEQRLQSLMLPDGMETLSDSLTAAVQVKERELEAIEKRLAPVAIHSTVAGRIAQVYAEDGAYVRQGESLLRLHEPEVRYILGYIREPLRAIPEPGTEVGVLTINRRELVSGVVTQVGNQLEPIHEILRLTTTATEFGLPIRIQIPPDTPLWPGERVQIRL